MKQFNKTEQQRYWSGVEDPPFKAELISGVVLSLAKFYIGKNAIDVGAGSGALLRSFQEKYKNKRRIVGIDLVPKSEDVQQGDCTNLQFEDGSFDTCFVTDVIEHMSDSDLSKCLNEANRVLKIGGHGVFTTLNNERLNEATVTCPECGCKFHRTGHCQVFDEARIRTLFHLI